MKFGEMAVEDQVHAYEVLKGRRLVRSFGSLRGVVIPEDNHDSIEEALELQPYVDLVYHYSQKAGYFLTDVTDTGDQLTAPMKPKETEGNRRAARFSAVVRARERPRAAHGHLSIDQEFMDQWTERTGAEMTNDTEEV